ncbi:MAG: hypothetical protein WBQ14_11555 [Gaiellaceae bacterium]
MNEAVSVQFAAIDEVLLLLSEARERSEGAARRISESNGEAHLVAALLRVDKELLALHRRLLDETLFHVPASEKPETQLALDAA